MSDQPSFEMSGGKAGQLAPLLLFMSIPILLLIGWVMISLDFSKEDAARAATNRAWELRAQTETLRALLGEAEHHHAEYVTERNAEHLADYTGMKPEIVRELDRFESSLPKAMDAGRLSQVRPAVEAALAELDRSTSNPNAAPNGHATEDARQLLAQVDAAQAGQIKATLASAERHGNKARVVVSVIFGFTLAALLGALFLSTRFMGVRTRMMTAFRAEADRRQAIFDSAMDAIVTLNPSGSIETLNKAAERMFGYSEDEIEGRDISVLAPLAPGESGSFIERIKALAGAEGHAFEVQGTRKSGETFPVDVNIGEMEQPDGPHMVAVMRDGTERKRAELAKNEFVSTVSHELRTPLTSIAGSLGLLVGGAAGQLPERAARLVSIAEANSRRLVRLINDILDMEKIESGKLVFEMTPFDFGELVERAVEGMSGLANELGVRYEFETPAEPLTVRGDADRLTQVLTNLLSNAAKFSPKDGRITVTAAAANLRARVSIKDEGSGIPAEFRDRIFQRFAQADSSDTRQKGGTGLGLAISKEIVERHGGRIWFESPPGEGATFHFELPLTDLSAEASPVSGGPRLLLCEDDPDVSRVLSTALTSQGFEVEPVMTLAGAEAALEDPTAFEALLLDLRLPDGYGLDLVRKLRARAATRNLPIIVISGDPLSPAASGLDLVDWIQKPVSPDRLTAALDQLMATDGERPLVLHVDDDPDLRHLVLEAFGSRCRLLTADSLQAARQVLATVTPQLVILDIGLPDGSGLDLLPELVDADGATLPVVIFSAQALEDESLSDAVDAVLTKSRTSLSQLIGTVRRLFRERDRRAKELV